MEKISAESFCYWLQGFFELSQKDTLTEEQVKQIKEHLSLVFVKVTKDSRGAKLFKDFQNDTKYCGDGTNFSTKRC